MDAPSTEVFGKISAITTDSALRLYIADMQGGFVRIFEADGSFVGQIGRPGDGPGEFVAPSAIGVGAGQEIIVGSRRGRLSYFSWPESPQARLPAFAGLNGIALSVWDLCVLPDGELAVQGIKVGLERPVQILSRDGIPEAELGRLVETHPVAQETLAWGHVACDTVANRIVYAPEFAGKLESYRTDGSLLWEWAIPEFRSLPFRVHEDGQIVSFEWTTDEGVSRVVSLHTADGRTLVQVGLKDSGTREHDAYRRIDTYVLDGQGTPLFSFSAPFVIDHIHEPFLYSVRRDPYPQVLVFEIPSPTSGS